MTWQEPIVVFVVGAAVTYLVWKLGLAGRPKKKRPGGPDVGVSRLQSSAKRLREKDRRRP